MSSFINIHIPKRSGLPTGKEARYMASNALGTAMQIGATAAGSAIRTSTYGAAMSPVPSVFDLYNDCLRTDGGLNDNNIVLRTDKGLEIEFINAIIDVTKANTIKEEALVNRAGKVKEHIQADDYTVKISGSLMGERDKFPYRDLYLLNQILSEAESIQAASVYLYIFDIDKLVLKSADFNQGYLKHFNVMPFMLTFVSDMDYDLFIKD